MKTHDTVKTEKQAKEIINAYVNENNLKDGYFKNSSIQCECGETQAIKWSNENTILIVGICDCCGNDNAFIDEVLNIF